MLLLSGSQACPSLPCQVKGDGLAGWKNLQLDLAHFVLSSHIK